MEKVCGVTEASHVTTHRYDHVWFAGTKQKDRYTVARPSPAAAGDPGSQ
jgi:hypothetical protein